MTVALAPALPIDLDHHKLDFPSSSPSSPRTQPDIQATNLPDPKLNGFVNTGSPSPGPDAGPASNRAERASWMRASLSDSLLETGTAVFSPGSQSNGNGMMDGDDGSRGGMSTQKDRMEVDDPFKGSPIRSSGNRTSGSGYTSDTFGGHGAGFVYPGKLNMDLDPSAGHEGGFVNSSPVEIMDRKREAESRQGGMSFNAGPPASHEYPPLFGVNGDSNGTANELKARSAASSSSSTPQPATATTMIGREEPIRIPASLSPPSPPHPLSLSAYLAAHPEATVKKALRKTYPKPNPLVRLARRFKVRHSVIHGLTDKEMRKLEDKEGKLKRDQAGWRLEGEPEVGADGRPRVIISPLFWKVYLSILPTLERDPLSGLVPPPLLGSTTTMPLSVISLIPDIMRHYRDVIVRAEKEVFLVTNYWQPSNSVQTITDAFRELSASTIARTPPGQPVKKVVVKLVYDRGTLEQIWNAHAPVPTTGWEAMKIPLPEEVPGIDIEVVNFHRLLLGTFHAKFLIVDRKVALINSNNIQDRPNLEMMQHFEGPIVDSFYETGLHSWFNKLSPMLPCVGDTYQAPTDGYKFGHDNPYFADIEIVKAAQEARIRLRQEAAQVHDMDEGALDRFRGMVRKAMEQATNTANERWDGIMAGNGEGEGIGAWAGRMRAGFNTRPNSRRPSFDGNTRRNSAPVVQRHFDRLDMVTIDSEMSGNSPTLVNEYINGDVPSATRSANKESFDHAQISRKIKIAEPDGVTPGSHDAEARRMHLQDGSEASTLPPSATSTLKVDSAGRPRSGSGRLQQLTEKFNATGVLSEALATVEDNDELDDFSPHVLHKPHAPFPIAMVNRKPHGMPGHHDIRNPQNAAWLAGCRYAQHKIFIQTPTLNARPIKRAIKQACRRGVEVVLYLDLGFNDKGESIPFQGGTNEEVVVELYDKLRPEKKDQYLKVYWYTGKDQIRPLNAVKKQRNCHIKFAMFDDEVAIFGNGNQDTQSWMHSQETNVMIYNREIVKEMMHTLHTNQNTHLYGLVDPADGIWRDKDGKDFKTWDPNHKKASGSMGLAGIIETIKKM